MSKEMLICTDCRQSQKSCMWKEQCVQLAYFKKRPTDSLAISAPAGEFLYKYHLREGIWHSARMPEALSIMSQFPQCPNCLSKDKQEECKKKKKIRLSSLTIILLSTSISLNDRQEVSGIPWPVRVHSRNIHSQNVVIKIYNKPCIKPCCVFSLRNTFIHARDTKDKLTILEQRQRTCLLSARTADRCLHRFSLKHTKRGVL